VENNRSPLENKRGRCLHAARCKLKTAPSQKRIPGGVHNLLEWRNAHLNILLEWRNAHNLLEWRNAHNLLEWRKAAATELLSEGSRKVTLERVTLTRMSKINAQTIRQKKECARNWSR
jgi:hypothetical protein